MMHPSLHYHVTPPDQRPYIPHPRRRQTAVQTWELGDILHSAVPVVTYSVVPPEPITSPYTPKDCLGCQQEFTPKAPNSLRCLPCAAAERKRKRDLWIKTKAINAATRQRGRHGAAVAKSAADKRAQRARQRSAA